MVRKALLVVAFTLWSRSIAFKIEMAALVMIVSAYAHKAYKPLVIYELDRIEGISLLANALVLVAGLGLFVIDDSSSTTSTSDTVALVLFFVFVLLCVSVLIWVVMFMYQYHGGDDMEHTRSKITKSIEVCVMLYRIHD